MKLGTTLAAATIALACGVGPAHAAPLTLDDEEERASGATFHLEGSTLVYTAAPGVNNWPSVSVVGGSLQISDPNQSIVPSAGCFLRWEDDDTTALCPMPAGLRLELGDGNDRDLLDESLPSFPITVVGGVGNDGLSANQDVDNMVTLDGGDGDDTLSGMQFADTLLGGPGKDTLYGNGGDDDLLGGDGDDRLQPDTMTDVVGDDLVDGGPGFDSVQDWSSSTADPAFAVSITVDGVANDGRPSGERDNVIGVERFDAIAPGLYGLADTNDSIDLPNYGASTVQGNGGIDTITGNDGTETIEGGAGDDLLEGGYNHDTITGGSGRDIIFADETSQRSGMVPFGNDVVLARDGEADVIDCGVGDDRAVVDMLDTVTNCEAVDRSGTGQGCQIPENLKGLTLRKARIKLRQANCTSIEVRKVFSKTVPAGRVVGAKREGPAVILRVSRGRR